MDFGNPDSIKEAVAATTKQIDEAKTKYLGWEDMKAKLHTELGQKWASYFPNEKMPDDYDEVLKRLLSYEKKLKGIEEVPDFIPEDWAEYYTIAKQYWWVGAAVVGGTIGIAAVAGKKGNK